MNDIKDLWKKLDESQAQQQMFNRQMLQQLMQSKTAGHIRTVSNADTLGLAVSVLVLLVFVIMMPALGSSISLLICYMITLVILLASIALGLYRISMLNRLDIGFMPVQEYQQQALKVQLLTARERFVSIIVSPIVIGCFYAVVTQFVKHENVFNRLQAHIPRIVAGIIAYIILAIIYYNLYYFKNIRGILTNLKEIEHFDR